MSPFSFPFAFPLILFAIAGALICFPVSTAAQEKGKRPEVKNGKKTDLDRLIEGQKEAAVRKNGVLLTGRVEIKSEPRKGDLIILHWSLDYNGPRQPLNILKPTLARPAAGQTYVLFHFVDDDGQIIGPNGRPYLVAIHANHAPDTWWPFSKEDFLEIKKGETAKGALQVIYGHQLASLAREKWPQKFQRFPVGRLFVELRHNPDARGESVLIRPVDFSSQELGELVDLDAWTGQLQTDLLEIPLKKLKATN